MCTHSLQFPGTNFNRAAAPAIFGADSFIGLAFCALARLAWAYGRLAEGQEFGSGRPDPKGFEFFPFRAISPAQYADSNGPPNWVFCARSAGPFIKCLAGESCFAAAHPPPPVRTTGIQRQAASDANEDWESVRVPAKVAAPAAEKLAEPSLRSPGNVGWQVAEEVAPAWAVVSGEEHARSLAFILRRSNRVSRGQAPSHPHCVQCDEHSLPLPRHFRWQAFPRVRRAAFSGACIERASRSNTEAIRATGSGVQHLLERLSNVRRTTGGWTARCPAHHDGSPSLSITERQGKILLHCFANCTAEAICASLGIRLRDLFTEPGTPAKPLPPVVRDAERHIHDLRSRLTPRDRLRPVVVVYADRQNPEPAMARALALAVEGELCQLLFKDQR